MAITEYRSKAANATKPLINLFKPMQLALIAFAMSQAATTANVCAKYYLRNAFGYDPRLDGGAIALVSDTGNRILLSASAVTMLVSMLLVSLWTFRAMNNLHLAKSPHVRMPPGWAVGWYFIPVANLWLPFRGMQEIWRGSRAMAGQPLTLDGAMRWWWALWVVAYTLPGISAQLESRLTGSSRENAGLLFDLLASVLYILCTGLLLRTTQLITDAQMRSARAPLVDSFV